MTTDQTEAAAVAVPLDAPVRPWEKCKEHGFAQPRVWACPTCLVELREENQRLRMDLENTRAEAVLAVKAAHAAERERCAKLCEGMQRERLTSRALSHAVASEARDCSAKCTF